jgi:hypothetical protein
MDVSDGVVDTADIRVYVPRESESESRFLECAQSAFPAYCWTGGKPCLFGERVEPCSSLSAVEHVGEES